MPPGLITLTETAPIPEGATALIELSLRIVNIARLAPNITSVAVVKPVPVRVTLLPPAMGPKLGDKLISIGAATYWNAAPLLVPEVVSSVTAITPADLGGVVAVTMLSEMTVKAVAAVPPKNTSRVLIKPVPVMVTTVPPPIGPEIGAMEVMTGDG